MSDLGHITWTGIDFGGKDYTMYQINCPRCGYPVSSETRVFLCACGKCTVRQWQAEPDDEPEPVPLPGLDHNGDAEVRHG